MTQQFDQDYWERHWRQAGADAGNPPNPYLARETGHLTPGTALDAGCGTGAEAVWLASRGWDVTAVDISPTALARAAEHAAAAGASERVRWVQADLGVWRPDRQFDLVTTHYAHPATPQLEFYDRLAGWVAPAGTLLIVGHLHPHGDTGAGTGTGARDHDHGHGQPAPAGGAGHSPPTGGAGHRPPAEASATAAAITARLDEGAWQVVTAEECRRTLVGHGGGAASLHDVVVRATRRR